MTCPKCHQELPSDALVCVACADARSKEACRLQQLWAFGLVLNGKANLRLRSMGPLYHVQMFGASRVMCWKPLVGGERKREMALPEFRRFDKARICEECRAEVDALLLEIAQCSV